MSQASPPGNLRLLWQAQASSQLSLQLFGAGFLLWMKAQVHSASLFGLLVLFSQLPTLLFSPMAGAVVDRHSPRCILARTDALLSLGFLVALLALYSQSKSASDFSLPLLLAVFSLGSVVSAFSLPAVASLLPRALPHANLPQANSVHQGILQISKMGGQLAGALLFACWGILPLAGLALLLAAGAAALDLRLRGAAMEKAEKERVPLSLKGELAEVLRYAGSVPGLPRFLFAVTSLNFFVAPLVVLLPFVVEDHLHLGPEWFGYFSAAEGLGMVLGFSFGSRLFRGCSQAFRVIFGLLGLAGFQAGLAGSSHAAMVLGMLSGGGFAIALVNVSVFSVIQRNTPPALVGRMVSVVATAAMLAFPIGTGLSGLLFDAAGRSVPVLFGACAAALAGLTLCSLSGGAVTHYLNGITGKADAGGRCPRA